MPVLADDVRVAGLARNHDDLRIGLHAAIVGMNEDLAESAGEGLVTLGIERLVAEEDHAMLEQGLTDIADAGLVEVLADIDIVDFGADAAGDGTHLDPAVAHAYLQAAAVRPAAAVFAAVCLAGGYGLGGASARAALASSRSGEIALH